MDIYCDDEGKTIGMVYRRAYDISMQNFPLEFNEIFISIHVAHKVYTMGDFNINLLRNHRSNSVADY